MNLHNQQKAPGKADQLTLASGGTEHVCILIECNIICTCKLSQCNKVNLSLCTNMADFCSDCHNYYVLQRVRISNVWCSTVAHGTHGIKKVWIRRSEYL